jgi:hypothetical protein
MTDPDAIERARRRVLLNAKKIEKREQRIELMKKLGRDTAVSELVLANLKTSQAIFEEHYRTLGGKTEE